MIGGDQGGYYEIESVLGDLCKQTCNYPGKLAHKTAHVKILIKYSLSGLIEFHFVLLFFGNELKPRRRVET